VAWLFSKRLCRILRQRLGQFKSSRCFCFGSWQSWLLLQYRFSGGGCFLRQGISLRPWGWPRTFARSRSSKSIYDICETPFSHCRRFGIQHPATSYADRGWVSFSAMGTASFFGRDEGPSRMWLRFHVSEHLAVLAANEEERCPSMSGSTDLGARRTGNRG